MVEKPRGTPRFSDEPDEEAPELTDEQLRRGVGIKDGKMVRRRGRPPKDAPKVHVTLRLDRDVIEFFQHDGPGWQGRMNDALKRVAAAGRRKAQRETFEVLRRVIGSAPAKKPKAAAERATITRQADTGRFAEQKPAKGSRSAKRA